jgi:uncharacterized membrane protein
MANSFTIVVKPYVRKNATLDDLKSIYNGRTCIVTKTKKFGGVKLHRNAEIIKGNFNKIAGSHSSPILFLQEEVHIRVTDFHMRDDVKTDQKHKQDIIEIIDTNY